MILGYGLAGICTILFFLWFGLAEFVPMFKSSMWMKIGAVLALLIVVFTLIHM